MTIPMAHKESLTLEYDLFDLPTSQHKAGLAGLLLHIGTMRDRRMSHVPGATYSGTSRARVVFTRASFQALFDDLYAASWVEREVEKKWPGKAPKKEVERSVPGPNGGKKDKKYVYDVCEPTGDFLKALYPASSAAWVKLWRDMLWDILRIQPATRKVYEQRANGQPSSQAKKLWDALPKSEDGRRNEEKRGTGELSGSWFIGAQATNAENVKFLGQVKDNLLLHFWAIASLIFVPQKLRSETKLKRREWKLKDVGYAIVVPEPTNLKTFVDDLRTMLGQLDTAAAGYRPRQARVPLPEEAGLEYLYHIMKSKIGNLELAASLAAVDILHVEHKGNSMRTHSAAHIAPDGRLLREYEALREKCHNPLFREHRVLNVLTGAPWHQGIDSVFNRYPWHFFVQAEDTPQDLEFFGCDVRRKLDDVNHEFQLEKGGGALSKQAKEDQLALCIHRLVQEYVNRKTEAKSGIKWDDFKEKKSEKGRVIYPEEYLKAQAKVCSDAFLSMRGRREADFIEYFTGSLCSVPQYLPQEEYLAVSQALLTDWATVKTLGMLALSACSARG